MNRISVRSIRLLASVFLIPALFFIVHLWRVSRTSHYNGANWKTDATGERMSLASLGSLVKHRPSTNIITVLYEVAENDGKWLPLVDAGKREYIEWDYTLEYNRYKKTLTKKLFIADSSLKTPTRIWVWENVDEQALYRVTEWMRPLIDANPQKNKEINAYKGGNLSELKNYGAVMHEEKP